MLAVDTNLIVRYLTGDDADQYDRATAVIEGQQVFVPMTVILETEWVLRSSYRVTKADIIRRLRAFAGLPTVTTEGGAQLAVALDLAEGGLDFADALHICVSAHCTGFATFDRELVRAAGAAGLSAVHEA